MVAITRFRSVQISPGTLWVGEGTPDTAMDGGDAYIQGTLEVDGALNLDGAIAFGNTLTVGESGTGYDVIFYGDTADNYLHWDADTDSLLVIGEAAKFRLGTFNASSAGYGSALSATNTAAFRVYADDGGASIGSGTLARAGVFRHLQTYTSGNREQEAAGVVGQIVSVAGTNRHNMCGVMGSYEMKGTITVDGQIASTDTWVQAGVIGRVGMGTGTLGLSQYGVLAGVAAMSNIATAVVQTYTGEYVGFYVGAWSGTDDFEIGLLIEDGKTGVGIDIGEATTGINFSGDMTTGINMTDSLSADDAILIAGANADAIHISGSNTVAGLHISGDQAIGILYDVDTGATDGIKIVVDDSTTLTTGINLCRTGTTGAATTGISIDTDGDTALSVGTGFTGTDMIVLGGTASGYGIEISGTCTTADLVLQDGATILDGATATGGSLTCLGITQDVIQLTGKVEIGNMWGADGAGAIAITDDGWDVAFQANAKLIHNSSGTAVAGGYNSLAVTITQTGSTSIFGSWAELLLSNDVDFSAADNAAAVWGHLEGGTTVSAPGTSGDFMTAFYGDVKMGATFTTGASAVVNGIRIKGDITATANHAGRLAAFECLVGSTKQPWDYGLYVADSTTGVYVGSATTGINLGGTFTTGITIAKTVGRAIQLGALSSTAQTGMTFVASTGIEAVSVYTDDGDVALTGGDPFVGIHSRSMFFQNQAGGTTCLGVFGQQKYEQDVDIGQGRTAAVEGYQEFMEDNDVLDSGVVVGVNSIIECSAGTLTVKSGGILAGFMARLSTTAGTAVQDSGGILAGLYIDENIGTGDWGYGIYVGSGDKQYYGTTTATGEAAVNTVDIVLDDACTQASGYAHALHIGLTNSGAKTGAASASQMNGIGVDYTQSGTFTGGINGIYVYMNDSGGPTLTSAQVVGGYFDLQEMGQTTVMACLQLDKTNETAASYADCFIHMVNQGDGATTNAFQFHGACATNLFTTAQANGFVTTGSVGGNQSHKLKCVFGGTTYYIPLNDA